MARLFLVFSVTCICRPRITRLALRQSCLVLGFHTLQNWWKIGFIFSLIVIPIFVFVGGAWWKLLGLW
ncbi:anion permease [Vibrio parahaemolyticus]|uniref:anion permease n=1 Tax=Vibrio parahaemolyticus TaxID=670 RepID=UPI003B21D394